jgi:SP family sugar:H+ symporter-like MFS transporter
MSYCAVNSTSLRATISASCVSSIHHLAMADATSSKMSAIWADIKTYRSAYILTLITLFGGMLFGWDTGLIVGVLTMEPFQISFDLKNTTDAEKKAFSNLSGNIVSVLQAGYLFGAMSSFYTLDRFGRRNALMFGTAVFLVGSAMQTCSGLKTIV